MSRKYNIRTWKKDNALERWWRFQFLSFIYKYIHRNIKFYENQLDNIKVDARFKVV